MQNPFRRLKHYRPDDIDPKENHATEALAACLVFSEAFRGEFIRFLFTGAGRPVPNAFSAPAQVEILTQHSTDESGTIDLLLRAGECALVVEIKVNAPEKSDHHRSQLEKYHGWLQTNFREGWMFTLVRLPDGEKHSTVLRRCTWSELAEVIGTFASQCENQTDAALLQALEEYLRLEGVVDKMDYSKLVDYGKGWAAESALEALFAKTTELVRFKIPDLLEPRLYENKGESPSFQFGRKKWASTFREGWNNKIYAWFCTSVTEGPECKHCEFRFEICLWHPGHGQDWKDVSSRLPQWMNHLDQRGFERGCYPKRRDWLAWEKGQRLESSSNYVVCPKSLAPDLAVTSEALKNSDMLAAQIADRVLVCIELVDELVALK